MTAIAPRHFALLVAVCAILGFNLIAIKAGVERLPPVFFSLLRFILLGAVVLPFLRPRRGAMGWLLVAAVCSGGLQFAFLFIGVSLAASMSSVAIVGQLGVPFTTLLSILVLGETVGWRRWSGILLAFAGVMVIGFNPVVFRSLAALSMVALGALAGAAGLVAVKKVGGARPLELQAWVTWSSLPVLLVLTLALEDGQFDALRSLDLIGAGAVAYTALVASLVGHTTFFWLVQRYPVSSVAPVMVLAPVFSVFFAVTLLGDALDWRMITGGTMTLAGVVIISRREPALGTAVT